MRMRVTIPTRRVARAQRVPSRPTVAVASTKKRRESSRVTVMSATPSRSVSEKVAVSQGPRAAMAGPSVTSTSLMADWATFSASVTFSLLAPIRTSCWAM